MDYGFGAVFGCPGHDQRDLDFALKYKLPIKTVVRPIDENENFFQLKKKLTQERHNNKPKFLNGMKGT